MKSHSGDLRRFVAQMAPETWNSHSPARCAPSFGLETSGFFWGGGSSLKGASNVRILILLTSLNLSPCNLPFGLVLSFRVLYNFL